MGAAPGLMVPQWACQCPEGGMSLEFAPLLVHQSYTSKTASNLAINWRKTNAN